jgi:hypothetical protein
MENCYKTWFLIKNCYKSPSPSITLPQRAHLGGADGIPQPSQTGA